MLLNFLVSLKEYIVLSPEKMKTVCKIVNCPICNGKEVIRNGHYTRNVRTLWEKISIRVQRLFCKSCNRSFNLLPCFVLPFKHWSLEVLEEIYESVLLKNKSVTKALLEISLGGYPYSPGFSTLYRMLQQLCYISKNGGDNIYTLGKELEPDYNPFSNSAYQDQLYQKKGSFTGKLQKLALQWITSKMLTTLRHMKNRYYFTPLSLLHFSSVFPTFSPG